MYIKLVSDLHLEFNRTATHDMFCPPVLYCMPADTDKETILVLAGDIGSLNNLAQLKSFLLQKCDQYHSVVYVPGNHEFYGTSIQEGCEALNILRSLRDNLYILSAGRPGVVIGQYVFFGDTMWSQVSSKTYQFSRYLNDYHLIKVSKRNQKRITPRYTSFLHTRQRMMIEKAVTEFGSNPRKLKKVLVSHHGPSPVSDHPDFFGSDLKEFFHNTELSESQVKFYSMFDLILHGHTHRCQDVVDPLTGVRTVANCVGYYAERTDYKENLLLSL